MSDVITANSWNGETGKHLALAGVGTRQAVMDIGSTWNVLRFQYQMMIDGPAYDGGETPAPRPTDATEFFIGVCAANKEYSHASSQAFGVLLGGGALAWGAGAATYYRPPVCGLKRVAGVRTIENYNYVYVARANNAVGNPMWTFSIIKGDPNWSLDEVLYVSNPPATTDSGKDQDYANASSLGSVVSTQRLYVDNQFATAHTTPDYSRTVAKPDEAGDGYMTCINIDWNIETDYTVVLQNLLVVRES